MKNPIGRAKGFKPLRIKSSHANVTSQVPASTQPPSDSWLKTNEKDTVKALFDKFIKNSSALDNIEDQKERVDTACVLIMNNLQMTKSSVVIPDPDSGGPTKKFQSFQRFVASLLAEDFLTETSSEAIYSSIEKIGRPQQDEELKNEESHDDPADVLSDDSLDPEKVLNYYQSPEKVVVDLGLKESPKMK